MMSLSMTNPKSASISIPRLNITIIRTLASMFPDLDRDIIDDVVRMKEGRYEN